jgi:hypothetical protein
MERKVQHTFNRSPRKTIGGWREADSKRKMAEFLNVY